MQFAAKVAEGKPLVAAYREVYSPSDGKSPTAYRNAKRSAKHPGIAARIKELQLELLPAPADMEQVYEHGLATVIQLCSCEDSKIRLMAAERLMAEAKEQQEKRRTLEATKVPDQREEILAELRSLYRKALPEQEPLVVEASEAPGEE
jgi:hypothetical protein